MIEAQSQLLVCDSFSHESEGNEETQLRLDLIRFASPVSIHELRVIPKGCPMHPLLTEPTKVGKTAPSCFKLELFVRNLNQPTAAVMEKFGTLEFDEANRLRFKAKDEIPTDAVVLRGWYANISVAIYGKQTEVAVLEVTSERLRAAEVSPSKISLALSPKDKQKSPSPMRGIHSDGTKQIVVDEATGGDAKDQEAEEAALGDFEPIASPEHDDDFQEMTDGHHARAKEYETIDSDEDIPDDIDIGDFGQEGDVDFNVYSEDAWMSVSVSFNPYQCDLLPLQSFVAPNQTLYERSLQHLQGTLGQDVLPEKAQQLFESITNVKAMDLSPRWVAGLEDLVPLIKDGLADLMHQKPDQEVIPQLVHWTVQALDITLARKQPVVVNIRQLKAGMSMMSTLSRCGDNIPKHLVGAGVIEQLCCLLEEPFMATTLKLAAIKALDSLLDFEVGMEKFLGWDQCEDGMEERTLYQRLIELFLLKQTPRVVTAGAAVLQKVNVYECLATLQQTVDRVASVALPESVTASPQGNWKSDAWQDIADNDNDNDNDNVENEAAMAVSMDVNQSSAGSHVHDMDDSKCQVVKHEPMDIAFNAVVSEGEEKQLAFSSESEDVTKPMMAEHAVSPSDVETIVKCLTNLLAAVRNASDTVVQPPLNCLPTKCRFVEVVSEDPYPCLVRFFKSRRLIEVLLVLLSSPHLARQVTVFAAVRDLLLFLMGFQQGLLYLASDSGTANEIIRVLTQATENDIPYTRAPSLSELLNEDNVTNCTAQCLGLLLIYYLQALQAVDLITSALKENAGDLDSAEVLSTLHTLYSMTFTPIGKEAVVSVLSWVENIECLLPFVEQQGNKEHDNKLKKSVSSRYAAVLILLTVQGNGDGPLLEKFGDRLLALSAGEHNNLSVTDLAEWMSPLKCLSNVGDVGPIPALVEQLKLQVDDLSTARVLSELPAIITLLRLLKYYGCPPQDGDDIAINLKWSVAVMTLFSANALEAIIRLLQKLNSGLTRPWRQGQFTSPQTGALVFATAQPLLLLVKTMLVKLFSASTEYRDMRLLSGLLGFHILLCSVMPAGSLAAAAQEVHTDIVEILSLFASPSLSGAVKDDVSKSCWCLMLSELLKHTLNAPQNFYSGLVLLSELLPLPLPLYTSQGFEDKEKEQLVQYRHLWAAHLLGVQPQLEDMLTALTYSTCPSLMQVLKRVGCQLADLSPVTAQMVARLFMTLADERLAGEGDTKLTPVKALEVLSELAAMASFKAGVLDCIQSDPDLLLPKLLLQLNSCSQSGDMAKTVKMNTVFFLQSLCDAYTNLTSPVLTMDLQQISDGVPDTSCLNSICEALIEHLTISGVSINTQLPVLRILVGLAEHEYGYTHLQRILDTDSETFPACASSLIQSLENTSDLSSEVLPAVSTLLHLIQLLGSQPVREDRDTVQEDAEITGKEETIRTSYMKPVQLRVLLGWVDSEGTEDEDHVLLRLLKRVQDISVEDESGDLLRQFDSVMALVKSTETDDSEQVEDNQDVAAELAQPQSIAAQFACRTLVVHSVSNERPDLDFWFGAFAPISGAPEPYMVKCNLEELSQKCCGNFSLKEEVEKCVVKSPPQSPTRDKKNKRKVDPLIAESVAKRPKPADTMMFTGRGYGGPRRGRDFFRLRQQNTSRPPSMHVDDFVAIDNSLRPRKMDNRARGPRWMSGQQAEPQYMGRGVAPGDYGGRWMGGGHRGPGDAWGYRPGNYPARGPGWPSHYQGDQYGRPGQWAPGKDDRRFGVAGGMYGHMAAGWPKRGHERGFTR